MATAKMHLEIGGFYQTLTFNASFKRYRVYYLVPEESLSLDLSKTRCLRSQVQGHASIVNE
jgi:hypothetical protein